MESEEYMNRKSRKQRQSLVYSIIIIIITIVRSNRSESSMAYLVCNLNREPLALMAPGIRVHGGYDLRVGISTQHLHYFF